MSYLIMGIALSISKLDIPFDIKQKITACTFYGVEAMNNEDIQKRFARCKKKWLK